VLPAGHYGIIQLDKRTGGAVWITLKQGL